MQYFTGKFQGHIPILGKDIKEAEPVENAGDARSIALLLTALYGGREWDITERNKEDPNFNFIIFRP